MKKKIYTKSGDKGKTSLLGGQRVLKSHKKVEAYGTVDELNSIIGMLLNFEISDYDKNLIYSIQKKLFDIGAYLAADNKCMSDFNSVCSDDILYLEKNIDVIEKKLPVLKKFIIPSGSELISWCNIARTVCRRAERRITGIKDYKKNYIIVLTYINRLSDLLFVMGRKYEK